MLKVALSSRLAVLGKLNNFVKEWIAEISELKVNLSDSFLYIYFSFFKSSLFQTEILSSFSNSFFPSRTFLHRLSAASEAKYSHLAPTDSECTQKVHTHFWDVFRTSRKTAGSPLHWVKQRKRNYSTGHDCPTRWVYSFYVWGTNTSQSDSYKEQLLTNVCFPQNIYETKTTQRTNRFMWQGNGNKKKKTDGFTPFPLMNGHFYSFSFSQNKKKIIK